MTEPTQRNDNARTQMTTAEATVAALVAHDIDTIYALPGVHNDSLFDALFRAGDRVRTIHTRHEQGAAYMHWAPRWRPRNRRHMPSCPVPACSIHRPRCSLPTE